MSSKRAFYTEFLAAAWMARHHGFQFKTARGQNMYFDGGSDFRTEKDCGIYGGEKYIIHPDSMHLLEPRDGDEGICDFSNQLFYAVDSWVFVEGGEDFDGNQPKNPRTDKRNGKPFHVPQYEEQPNHD